MNPASPLPQFDLNPPQEGRFGASLLLAVLAHLLLLSALTWGISWNKEAILESSTAELWSSNPNFTPQSNEPVEKIEPEELPQPTPSKAAPPLPSKANSEALKDAQLAVEKLKKKEEEEKKEKERLAKLELDKQRQKELEKKKLKELELEKARKLEEEKLKLAKEREKAKKETPKPDPKEVARQQAKEAKEMEKRRMEDLSRVQRSLNNSSSATASGSGAGPASATNMSMGSGSGNAMSANYAGKVIDHIKRNMGVHKEFSGNPSTEIKINCAPDGSITLSQVTKKSGDPEWDEVVNKAIEKIRTTSKMPRDSDGRVPPVMIIAVKPYESNP
jgi:colicin import membrane protein